MPDKVTEQTISELTAEISDLRKKLMTRMLTSDTGLLNTLKGCEIPIRALEVAMVQDHEISFIGGGELPGLLQIVATQAGLLAHATAQCPCGNFGSVLRECTCTLAAIRRFQRSRMFRSALNADIIVEVVSFVSKGRPYDKPLTVLMHEAEEARDRLPVVEFQETQNIRMLIELLRKDFPVEDSDMRRIIEVSRSIRAMHHYGQERVLVEVSDFVEAIQYVHFRYRPR